MSDVVLSCSAALITSTTCFTFCGLDLFDLLLPGAHGLEFRRALRDCEQGRGSPIVRFASREMDEAPGVDVDLLICHARAILQAAEAHSTGARPL